MTDIKDKLEAEFGDGAKTQSANDIIFDFSPDNEPYNDTPITEPLLPEGIKVIDLIENQTYNIAKAIQHAFSATNTLHKREDIAKAQWYLSRELDRMDEYGDYK